MKCTICGKEYSIASFGGPGICSACDSGRKEIKSIDDGWTNMHTKQRLRAEAAEAREAALVACLREARDVLSEHIGRCRNLLDEDGIRCSCSICDKDREVLSHVDALLPAQPQQEAPDPSLTLLRELRDALNDEHESREMALGGHKGRRRTCPKCLLIKHTTRYLRQRSANNPGTDQENAETAEVRETALVDEINTEIGWLKGLRQRHLDTGAFNPQSPLLVEISNRIAALEEARKGTT